jgi:tetratricopeptide (TPR) repeat protein
MKKIMAGFFLAALLMTFGCREKDENREFYFRGVKAEHQMQYDKAIELYAKALTYNRQDAISWNAKGRCHLLLVMSSYFLAEDSSVREVRIKGNLSKAQDCFRRAQQWGYSNSAETDLLEATLQEFFNPSPAPVEESQEELQEEPAEENITEQP